LTEIAPGIHSLGHGAIVYDYPQTVVAMDSVRIAFLVLTQRGWRAY